MANKDKENKIKKFTKEAIGKTLNEFNKEIGMADLVEINKNQDRILNGILSQVNDENTEKTEKSNIITLDNSTDGIVELKEIQGDTNVNVSKIEEMPITHDIGDKEGNVFTLNEITQGAISIGEIQGNTMVNCNKDDKKELVLMKDLSTQGDNNIDITEGVDGGKVDVALEGNTLVNVSKTKDNYITHEREEDTTGNHIALADEGYIRPVLNGKTMVNVCDQKEPIAVTKSYTVENSGNHVALQGEYDGKCRPVVTGNTLVNLASNSNLWEVGCSGDVNTDYTITSTDDQGIVIDKLTDNVDYLYFRKRIDPNLFKSNTTYTIIFNSSKAYRVGIVSGNTAEVVLPLSPCNDGYNTIIVTSTDLSTVTGTAPIYAYLSINKQYIGTAKVSDFIALEGDYSDKPIPDYFEGLQSSFEDRVVPERLAHFPSTILTTPSSGYTHREFGDTLSLKPSTTYTIVQKAHKTTNHSPVNTNAHPYTLVFGGRQGVSDSWIVRANPPVGDIKEGVSAYTLTTPNDFVISTQTFMVIVEENKGSEFELEVSIFEGDYTNYNFSDYDPTKVGKYRVDYKVTGKNKAYGLKQQIPDVLTTKINVTKGKSYTYSTQNIADGTCRISICNSEPYNSESLSNAEIQLISDWGGGNHTWVSEVTGTVWFIIWQRDITINSNSTLQIEEGTTSTSYEPYKEYTKTLYLNSPLLEGDTIEQYGNNIAHVHRYSKVVLDGGTSPWGNVWWTSNSGTTDTVFSGGLSSAPYEDISYCDKLPIVTPSNLSSYDTAITIDGESIIRINIPKELLSRNKDLSAFRTWLTNNPVTLVGRLKTPQYEVISTNDELLTDSYVNGHLDFESAVPVEKVVFELNNIYAKYIYPSTNYNIQFESDNIGEIKYIYLGGTYIWDKPITKGINKFIITTSDTIDTTWIGIDGIGFNASNIVVTPAIEQDFDYFSGLSSSFEDGLVTQEMIDSGEEVADNLGKYRVDYKVTGKNKFDVNNEFTSNATIGKDYVTVNGNTTTFTTTTNTTVRKFFKIKVEPNTTYTISGTISYGMVIVYKHTINNDKFSWDTSHIHIYKNYTPYENNTLNLQFTTGSDEYEVYVRFSNEEIIGTSIFANIQVEEGSVITSYEPYKESTKTLYLNSPLLEGDTIEEKEDGIYHVHRYEKVVLDGSEDEGWRWNNVWSDDSYSLFYTTLIPKKVASHVLSDKMPCYENIIQNSMPVKEGFRSDVGNLQISISTSKLATQDVNGFKLWLQSNPVTLVYELASPQYELIQQSDTIAMPTYSAGHLDVTTAVPLDKVNFLHFEEELTYLYPSTSYTVQFTSDNAITVDINLGGTQLLSQNIVKGLNRISITTPATLANNKLVIDGVGAKISEVVVTDTDREFRYFEGMKSVGEGNGIEILSHNGNLYKRLENSYYKIYGSSVVVVEDNEDSFIFEVSDWDKGISYLISTEGLFKNKKYKLTWEKYNELAIPQLHASGITLLNSNKRVKEQVSFEKISNVDWNFELPDSFEQGDILEIRFKTSIASGQNGACNICINEVGVAKNTALSKLNKQQLTHEPLRGVGDVKDRYVLIDGKWYIERKCGEVILDGSIVDGDVSSSFPSNNSRIFYIRKPDAKNVRNALLCDNFKANIDISYSKNRNIEGVFVSVNGSTFAFYFRIFNNKLSTQNINGFKEWLRNNPTRVAYQLKTPVYEPIDYNPLETYSGTTHITTNSIIPTNITIKNHGYNCLLKPSTTYTVSSNLGLNTVTTPSVLTEDCLRFYDTDTSTVTTMKNVMVLEGDYTTGKPLPSHFAGIESAFEQEYDEGKGKYKVRAKVVGKNLFDGKIINNSAVNTKGNILSDTNSQHTDYIKVIPNTSYIFTNIPSFSNRYGIVEYDLNKNFVKFTNSESNVFISSPTTHYVIRYYYKGIDGVQQIPNNIQVEQGTEATPYEPYKENYIEFYIDEPLRGVEDSKDRVFIQGDKVIVERKCGVFTLNGKNNYRLSIGGWENKTDVCTFEGYKPTPTAILDYVIRQYADTIPSLTFSQQWEGSGVTGREGISGHPKGGFVLSIKRSKLKTQDENGLDEYLRENPIRVVYQLAEPIYEEVEYSSNRLILDTFNNESFNNSTLFYESNIPVSNTSFKPLWEELVYLKNSTKYYIQFNSTASGTVVFNLGGTEVTKDIVEGYNNIAITTPAETTNLLTIDGHGINISEVVISESVCGGHYLGLQSCFEEHMENGKYRILLRGIALDGNKVNGIKLYINEPLRGIKDARDRLCIKNGKLMVERKCSSVTLDGSDDENWRFHKLESSGKYAYVSGKSLGKYKINNDIISNVKSVNWSNEPWTITDNYFISFEGTGGNIYSYTDYINLNDFKSNLNNNPIILVYPLVEPVYEEATNEYGLPIVFEGYENGIVYIDSAVTPTTHIKYTSNNQLATTLSEAEEQNIATQEDINMNVVTYMMDIDMILTEMEMSNDTSVMAVRRDSSNENMLDRMSKEDKKVYQDNTVVMLEKMITANVLEKEDIEGRINMYYNKNRISKEQYEYLKSLL